MRYNLAVMQTMQQFLRRQWGLLLCAATAVLAYGGMVRLHLLHGTLREGYVPQTIAWYLLAFGAYLGALLWAEWHGNVAMRGVWATAVLFRLLLLFTTPTLSDDVYRYLWDGYVAHNGVSPYAYPINAPALDFLDIPQRAQANNAWMASPYLPAAQLVFFGLTFAFPLRPLALQIGMVIFDLLSAFLIARLLALASLPRRRLLIYLWNPLVIVEVAHSAHIDAWMILLTLTAVWLTLAQRSSSGTWRSLLAPVFLALATLTKIIPVLLLPLFFWRWRWRQVAAYGLVIVALLIPAGVHAGWGLTGELDGKGLFGALRIYQRYWNFNSGIFHWLEKGLGAPGFGAPSLVAQLAVLVMMLLVMLVVWWRARCLENERTVLRLAAVPFMAYLLFNTTVHPWYMLILVAFLPFLPPGKNEPRWRWTAVVPWLYLSGALIFSYLTYLDPLNFAELEWVRRLQWGPTLVFVLVTLVTLVGQNDLTFYGEG